MLDGFYHQYYTNRKGTIRSNTVDKTAHRKKVFLSLHEN